MALSVGVRALRQSLSKYLERVKAGGDLVVTEHGHEVARIVPASTDAYAEPAARLGASVPIGRVEDIVPAARRRHDGGARQHGLTVLAPA